MANMVISGGVRYKEHDAIRLGLTPDVAVITPNSVEVTSNTETTTNGEPGDNGSTETTTNGESGDNGSTETTKVLARPSNGGSKADWVAYAVSKGMDAETLEGMSRDAIAAAYPVEN